MDKKLKYLSAIPLFGTCILLVYLFVLSLKNRISRKRFIKAFWICSVVAAICCCAVFLILKAVTGSMPDFNFNVTGRILVAVIAGYMMNAFTFIYLDKIWYSLYLTSSKPSLYERNKKLILIGAFVVAIVITIVALVLMSVYGLI